MAESLTVNGVDLATLMTITNVRGLHGAPPIAGGDYELPRRNGSAASGAPRWAAPRIVTVEGIIQGGTSSSAIPADARARYLDRVRSLGAVLYANGGDFLITRVIPRVSGGDLTVTSTGRLLGGLDAVETLAAHAGRVSFDIKVLDALWYATADTTGTITGTSTVTVIGDVGTKRLTLTFSGATGQRLTNNTTGEWVQIVGSAVNATVIDCENFTATRSAASVAGEVTHNGAFTNWMSLGYVAAGNSLTLTGGGSLAYAYREAYL